MPIWSTPFIQVPARTKAKLKAATTEHMQTLEKSPERVKKYFQDARVKYAAWKLQTSTGRINNVAFASIIKMKFSAFRNAFK